MEVAEVLAVEARQLAVEVRPASRAARSVVLDLPPADDCVRLLRDPFHGMRTAAPVVPHKTAPLRTFTFSADGRRLLLFRTDGSVGAMAIPHSVRATVPKARRVTPPGSQKVLGAGWRNHGGLVVLVKDQLPGRGEYVVYGQLRGATGHGSAAELFQARDKDEPPTGPVVGHQPGRLLSFLDANQQERLLQVGFCESLFLIEESPATRRIEVSRVVRNVLAAAEVNRKVVFVTRDAPLAAPGADRGAWLGVVEKDCVRHIPLGAQDGQAYFGFAGAAAHADAGLLAVRHKPGIWRLFAGKTTEDVHLPIGMRVVGTGTWREAPGEVGLLALDSDRRTFWFISTKGHYKVAVALADVLHTEASHALPVLGWSMKEGGGMVLFNLREGGVLYQSAPEGGG
ncbi:hypothetical protein ACLESO_56125, partial [Pyxidicoccus sp. 3LG]